jgi:MoaD family protein
MAMLRVRLFAALREEAGSSEVEAEASTVGDALEVLCARYGDRFARIAGAGSVVVNGDRARRDRELTDGDEVAILPPVSGGARP